MVAHSQRPIGLPPPWDSRSATSSQSQLPDEPSLRFGVGTMRVSNFSFSFPLEVSSDGAINEFSHPLAHFISSHGPSIIDRFNSPTGPCVLQKIASGFPITFVQESADDLLATTGCTPKGMEPASSVVIANFRNWPIESVGGRSPVLTKILCNRILICRSRIKGFADSLTKLVLGI